MKTVHLIFNAHLDPIYLWPWPAGLDEVLATCRSACDRLDANPDLFFSRGEAWLYEQVERCDPALFERIRRHIQARRWEIVGGWWLQPDCNLPSGWGFGKQIELGREYFLERFGIFPRIGYNVDSFGHAATLPGYMKSAGQDCYVMMRPREHEMNLPARLFRWRGFENGPEVTTFRIAREYNTSGGITLEHVQNALTELPEGTKHTMCFVGVGDHGGGPTERQIAWCREHRRAIEGWQLEFSTPSRFFAAIEPQIESLPLFTGELQQHAIGCYSVHRSIKTAVRRAEHRLAQAEIMTALPDAAVLAELEQSAELSAAWKRVCFSHFHDTLGGSILATASRAVEDQLGFASAIADDALHLGLRRIMRALPNDTRQRIVIFNASSTPFEGYVEVEPWLSFEGRGVHWDPQWRLTDEKGDPVPMQILASEARDAYRDMPRLLFKTQIASAQWRWCHIENLADAPVLSQVQTTPTRLANESGTIWTPSAWGCGGAMLPLPQLDLIEDGSDTWSHGFDRYPENPLLCAHWEHPVVVDNGPLLASITQHGTVGHSQLSGEWRIYADEQFVEWHLRVHWAEKGKLLKLTLPFQDGFAGLTERSDGIPGGAISRPNDGRELPLRDWTLIEGEKIRLGVVCPDVYAIDATSKRLRLTLLRSAVMAHHNWESQWTAPAEGPRQVVSDQGIHEFRFRFFLGSAVTQNQLDWHAFMMQRPPLHADLTRGMLPL